MLFVYLTAHIALQFRVFGVVVDKKMLVQIGSTVAGALAAGIPIVFGLRQDLNEEFTHNAVNTTSHEQLQQQLTAQQQQLVALQQQLGLTAQQQQLQLVALQQQLNLLLNSTS
eukprot:SAG31_NODE_20561_length_571_cov_0.673729_1_plen_113_part_00